MAVVARLVSVKALALVATIVADDETRLIVGFARTVPPDIQTSIVVSNGPRVVRRAGDRHGTRGGACHGCLRHPQSAARDRCVTYAPIDPLAHATLTFDDPLIPLRHARRAIGHIHRRTGRALALCAHKLQESPDRDELGERAVTDRAVTQHWERSRVLLTSPCDNGHRST